MNRLLVSFLAMLLMMPACITSSAYFGNTSARSKQVLYYWNATEPRTFDPHKTSGVSEQNIILNLLESLTSYDPQTLEP
jgi:ABC-type oligopeptide transport system substrate-binding subunit